MSANSDSPESNNANRLAARVRAGDRDAFKQLVVRYEPGLTRVMLRRSGGRVETAEELVHQTWIVVWQSLSEGRYDPRKAAVSTFIYAVANKLWLQHLRKLGRAPTTAGDIDFSVFAEPPEQASNPATMLQAGETLEAMRGCLHVRGRPFSLTSVERQVVIGLASGKTERELAEELGLAPSTVHARKHLAYKKIRRCMAAKGY